MDSPDITIEVNGMMCQKNCGTTVENAIKGVHGVKGAAASFASSSAFVWLIKGENGSSSPIFDKQLITKNVLEAIEDVGFEAVLISNDTDTYSFLMEGRSNQKAAAKVIPSSSSSSSSSKGGSYEIAIAQPGCYSLEVKIAGMSCASCVRCIESGLIKIQAIKSIRIGLLSEKAEIVYDALQIEPEEIVSAIKSLGYGGSVVKTSKIGSLNKEVYFSIGGMSCSNCSAKIEKDLLTLPGVKSANVSCTLNKACVIIDESISNAMGVRDIIERVEDLGYGCSLGADDGSSSTDGYDDIRQWRQLLAVALVLGLPVLLLHMTMTHIPILMDAYMEPMLCSGGISTGNVLTCTASSLMQVLVGYKYYRSALFGAMHANFGMDCLVVTGTTITFVYSCVQLLYSCRSHVIARHVFFEASTMLLMFVTFGKFIEAYAKGKTVSAITKLLEMQPRNALLLSNAVKKGVTVDSPEEDVRNIIHQEVLREISVELVQRGDILKVLPGSRIPTDGFILHGSTHVDESMITGESLPQRRIRGDLLFGSTLNQSGAVYLQVSSVGSESALAQIIRLVERAQMNKAPIQAYADRAASVFTPIVLCLALTTFLVWSYLCAEHLVPSEWYSEEYGSPVLFSMLFGISVVVVSCPCALGLATPTAIMVGTSVGAQHGILIKGGPAFEAAQKVNVVVFDKTGTLTVGKPSVTDELVFMKDELLSGSSAGSDKLVLAATGRMLELALAAEKGSEHPLAMAITKAAAARGLVAPSVIESSFEIDPGRGICCSIAEGRVLVGNRSMLSSKGIAVTAAIERAMWKLESQGKTAICVALDEAVLGVIGVADTLKPDSYSAISALKKSGIEVWMITGDNSTTATAIADELDIRPENVLAGVMPIDKVSKIEALQATGKFVAMVGDGINDSPALARADLGVAIGAGTQVAIEAADMVLVRNRIGDVVVALDLSRVVFRRIKLNFLWALVYNLAAIPFAAGLWFPWTHMLLPPQYAGLSMAFSSISVVLSSMALRFYKRPQVLEESANGDHLTSAEKVAEGGMSAMILSSAEGGMAATILSSGLRGLSTRGGKTTAASSFLYTGFAGGSSGYSKLSTDDERDSIEMGVVR